MYALKYDPLVVVGVSFISRFRLWPLMGTRQERPSMNDPLVMPDDIHSHIYGLCSVEG
jgi:hypothetical protein